MGKTYRRKPHWVDDNTFLYQDFDHIKVPVNISNEETRKRKNRRSIKDKNKLNDGIFTYEKREEQDKNVYCQSKRRKEKQKLKEKEEE